MSFCQLRSSLLARLASSSFLVFLRTSLMSFPSRVSYNQESDILIGGASFLDIAWVCPVLSLWHHESLDLGPNGFLRTGLLVPQNLCRICAVKATRLFCQNEHIIQPKTSYPKRGQCY